MATRKYHRKLNKFRKTKKRQKGGGKSIRSNTDIKQAVNLWCSNHAEAEIKYGHISAWDVSNVTNMLGLFEGKPKFNEDISNWNVSNVTTMKFMFNNAIAFNQPIGDWNVSKVITMFGMFDGARAFNQPIGHWDVSKVKNMGAMFADARNFNNGDVPGVSNTPLNWDVSNVTEMLRMFDGAKVFNQPIGDWDVSKVEDMSRMFQDAKAFNQPIGCWDVEKLRVYVDNKKQERTLNNDMFKRATKFNKQEMLQPKKTKDRTPDEKEKYEALCTVSTLQRKVLAQHPTLKGVFNKIDGSINPDHSVFLFTKGGKRKSKRKTKRKTRT